MLSSGIHVQDVQVCYHVLWWFAAPSIHHLGVRPHTLVYPDALPPPAKPQCALFPSLCPCILIVQLPLMSGNMQGLIFVLVIIC